MSIIIKGMEMPKDCQFCPMAHWNKLDQLTGCDVVGGKRYVPKGDYLYWYSEGRPDWCPLVEVPKHGRLIEADKLMDKIRRYGGGGLWSEEELYFTVKDMPTIIEAEE